MACQPFTHLDPGLDGIGTVRNDIESPIFKAISGEALATTKSIGILELSF